VTERWQAMSLGDFVLLQRGHDLPARSRRPGSIVVLGSNGPVGFHDVAMGRGPGVVLGRATNLGRPTWWPDDFWPLNTTLYVKDFRGNDPRFTYYLFESLDLSGYDSGSVQPMLNRNYIAGVPLLVPPPDEQRVIAEVLGALDDKIESNSQRAEAAEALLDVLASRGRSLPSVALREVVEVDRIACIPAAEGETLVDHFSLPAFDAGRLPHRVPGHTIKSHKLVVSSESVLVSRLNPSTNRTWLAVPDPLRTAAASTEFMVLRPSHGVCLGSLWLAVRDETFRSELARRATGTSGSHQRVRPDDFLAIDVPDVRGVAPDTVIEAEALLRLVHHARVESTTLAELRDALLPELLSGRLRVPIAAELIEAAT
jgi:type I restriction enzyme S subunit